MVNRAFVSACVPVVLANGNPGQTAIVKCLTCGRPDEWRIASRLPPPEIIHKHFIKKGWRLGRKPICPECQNRRTETVPSATTPPPPKPEPTAAARKAKQLVFLALLDYYDETKRVYKPGHSDRTIAETAGCAEEFVRKVREADFGPLTMPDAAREIREQFAELSARIEQMVADKLALHAQFDRLCLRNGWVVE